MGKKRKGDRIGEEGRWERHKEDDEHKVKNEPVTKFLFYRVRRRRYVEPTHREYSRYIPGGLLLSWHCRAMFVDRIGFEMLF